MGRSAVVLLVVLAGVWAAWQLELSPAELVPNKGGVELTSRFFASAASPALYPESPDAPPGTPLVVVTALAAVWTTVRFAACATSVALLLGGLLGILASGAFWDGVAPPGRTSPGLRAGARSVHIVVRIVIALLRSVHELLWAVLLLAAVGLGEATAIVALALPYTGTIAKVFSEMLDEVPKDSSDALVAAGAGQLQSYAFGRVPRALPDLGAYSMYRFECALRSSAILGFFGFPTLGLYVKLLFENTLYGEVWTYLFSLFVLIALVDWWSGAVRARLVST